MYLYLKNFKNFIYLFYFEIDYFEEKKKKILKQEKLKSFFHNNKVVYPKVAFRKLWRFKIFVNKLINKLINK